MQATEAAVVGIADHAGWAILVTAAGGALVDRRQVELLAPGLPCLPHHCEGQRLPIEKAIELVERVTRSAHDHALARLGELSESLGRPVAAIAMRRCPELPGTIAERLTSYRAQNCADTVMYRTALAEAARTLGWSVRWYEAKTVYGEAARALGRETIETFLTRLGKELGPPWRQDHRMAMAAAIATARQLQSG